MFTQDRNFAAVKSFIDSLADNKIIRDTSKPWLTVALDPSHDDRVSLQGYPDVDTSDSTVVLHKGRVTVTKPSGLAGGATWDAVVFNCPMQFMNQGHEFYGLKMTEYGLDTATLSTGTTNVGPLTVIKALTPTSTATNLLPCTNPPTAAAWNPTTLETHVLQAKSDDHKTHLSRHIAFGFKVVNVSPEISKSGSVVVGNVSQHLESGCVDYFLTGTVDTNQEIPSVMFSAPPGNADDAAVYPSSRTWDAAEGAYCVAKLGNIQNEPTYYERKSSIIRCEKFSSSVDTVLAHKISDQEYEYALATNLYHGVGLQTSQFNTSYAYFSGLHEDTVLELTQFSYVELFPRHNQTLIGTCSPSSTFDSRALELYSEVSGLLPPGVPANMNPKGEFWKMVLRALKTVAATAMIPLTLVAPEVAAPVGASIAAMSAGSRMARRGKKKQRQKNQNVQRGVVPNRRAPQRRRRI